MSQEISNERNAERWTAESLGTFLSKYKILTDAWGVGNAKTIKHLLQEIQSGESVLKVINGQIMREVTSMVMDVYYQKGEEVWRLIEEKQIFSDGHTRVRNDWVSMGEKMMPNENPEIAIHRALSEELKISGRQSVIERPIIKEDKMSESYPGLISRHIRHRYDIVLQEKDFKPEGYVEIQPDKKTYFIWKKTDKIPDFT